MGASSDAFSTRASVPRTLATADPIVGKCCPGRPALGREATAEAPRRQMEGKEANPDASSVGWPCCDRWRSCVGQQVGGSVRSDIERQREGALRPLYGQIWPTVGRAVTDQCRRAPSRYAAAESPAHAFRLPRSARRRAADPRRDRGARWDAAGAGARRVRRRVRVELDGAPRTGGSSSRRTRTSALASRRAAEKAPDGPFKLLWAGRSSRRRGSSSRSSTSRSSIPVAAEGVADRGTSVTAASRSSESRSTTKRTRASRRREGLQFMESSTSRGLASQSAADRPRAAIHLDALTRQRRPEQRRHVTMGARPPVRTRRAGVDHTHQPR